MDKYKKPRKTKSNENSEEYILHTYLKEIGKKPLLSAEEEKYHAREYSKGKGNKNSRQTLIKSNLRYVVKVAEKYQNRGLPLEDLISEGNIGLIEAVERFDGRGRFTTYAIWWIRQSILKAISEKARQIRLPSEKNYLLTQINQLTKYIQKEKNYTPTNKEIAELLNKDEKLIANLLTMSQNTISLETLVYTKDENYIPEDSVINKDLKKNINNLLKTIPLKEAKVIECRFELNGTKKLTFREIGEKFNLSKERIRQIEKKALARLKHPSKKNLLENYLYD